MNIIAIEKIIPVKRNLTFKYFYVFLRRILSNFISLTELLVKKVEGVSRGESRSGIGLDIRTESCLISLAFCLQYLACCSFSGSDLAASLDLGNHERIQAYHF